MRDTLDKGKGRWFKAIDEYRLELKLPWDKLLDTDRPTLKRIIKLYDTAKWEEGLRRKTSLRFYIQEKKEIHYDLCYRNNRNSMFYARARINAIKLEEHRGRGIEGYDKTCKLCKDENEDLVHFITKCRKLEGIRDYNLLDNNINNPEDRMRKLLFRDSRCYEVGKMVKGLWTLRRKLLKNTQDRQRNNIPESAIDSGQSRIIIHSRSDPGPRKRGTRDNRLSNRSLSKG